MARHGDAELAELLKQFVCVRVVQMYGVDVSLFQFHGQLTWAAFFLNADRTIYGRYGSRGPRRGMRENDKDVTLEGFKMAVQGALEVHKAYPGNKAALAGKTGPALPWPSPEKFPAAQGRPPASQPAEKAGGRQCIHCHQVQDWEFLSNRKEGKPVADRSLWTFPMPDVLGLGLDPAERSTVSSIQPGSAAEKAGLKAGDRIVAMDGQPLLSIADVQWVLHQAKEPGSVKVEVDRGGKRSEHSLALAEGWRRVVSFADTLSLGWVTRQAVAGMRLEVLPAADRAKLGLADGALALRIVQITPDQVKDRNPSPKKLGLAKDDVITGVDGMKSAMSESDFLSYLVQKKGPGQKVELTYVRGGASQKAQLELP